MDKGKKQMTTATKHEQVIKVIWHKTASPPQTDSSIVFARWRQCARRGGHIGATWRIRLNVCFLQYTRVHSSWQQEAQLSLRDRATRACQLKSG